LDFAGSPWTVEARYSRPETVLDTLNGILQAEGHRLALAGFWPDNTAKQWRAMRAIAIRLWLAERRAAGRQRG